MNKIRNQKSEIRNRKAFTLVEILAVLFLSSLIVLSAYSIFLMSNKVYKRTYTSAELTQNARIALERMSRDLRQAMEILTTLPVDPGSGTPAIEIKFQDGHGFLDNNKIQYITYYLSGTDLHRKYSHFAFSIAPTEWVLYSAEDALGNPPTEYTDSDQVKAENISLLQFWGQESQVTIHLSVADTTNSYTFETITYLRNIN